MALSPNGLLWYMVEREREQWGDKDAGYLSEYKNQSWYGGMGKVCRGG